jgi:hypothetical protein
LVAIELGKFTVQELLQLHPPGAQPPEIQKARAYSSELIRGAEDNQILHQPPSKHVKKKLRFKQSIPSAKHFMLLHHRPEVDTSELIFS